MLTCAAVTVEDDDEDEDAGGAHHTCTVSPLTRSENAPAVVSVTAVEDVVVTVTVVVDPDDPAVSVNVPSLLAVTSPNTTGPPAAAGADPDGADPDGADEPDDEPDDAEDEDGAGTTAIAVAARLPSEALVPRART